MKNNVPTVPLAVRLERMVSPEPNTGCWLWTGTIIHSGYGMVRDQHPSKRNLLAHRAAYQEWVGPIPAGLHVLHRCDMPCCVNPAHLFLGTHLDNMHDMMRKKRHRAVRGEAVYGSVLTERVAAVCREAAKLGASGAGLAAAFGVDASTMQRLIAGTTWSD